MNAGWLGAPLDKENVVIKTEDPDLATGRTSGRSIASAVASFRESYTHTIQVCCCWLYVCVCVYIRGCMCGCVTRLAGLVPLVYDADSDEDTLAFVRSWKLKLGEAERSKAFQFV